MRMLLMLGAAAMLALAAAAAILRGQTAEERELAERVARLVEQLGSDEFAQRELAAKELDALGEPALAELRRAAVSSDSSEIRWRAQRLLTAPERRSKSIGLELVLIKPGEFPMGSPDGEAGRLADEKLHRVRITRPFYLGKYEVTQEEYRLVMKTSPSWFAASGGGRDKAAAFDTTRFPVERVSWFDAIEFCNQLSKLDGFSPYYRLADVQRSDDSMISATVTTAGGYGYRLPTEAEWEFACRAETAGPHHYGGAANGSRSNVKGVTIMGGYGGVIMGPNLQRTTTVGSYAANAWGLFDMHGNAGEWCWDWYDKGYYDASPAADPAGPESGTQRTLRGGSWLLVEGSCRSASRAALAPDERTDFAGFRIARNP